MRVVGCFLEGGSEAAFFVTVTVVLAEISPFLIASNAIYSVIILVNEAGWSLVLPFLDLRTFPVRLSITTDAYLELAIAYSGFKVEKPNVIIIANTMLNIVLLITLTFFCLWNGFHSLFFR